MWPALFPLVTGIFATFLSFFLVKLFIWSGGCTLDIPPRATQPLLHSLGLRRINAFRFKVKKCNKKLTIYFFKKTDILENLCGSQPPKEGKSLNLNFRGQNLHFLSGVFKALATERHRSTSASAKWAPERKKKKWAGEMVGTTEEEREKRGLLNRPTLWHQEKKTLFLCSFTLSLAQNRKRLRTRLPNVLFVVRFEQITQYCVHFGKPINLNNFKKYISMRFCSCSFIDQIWQPCLRGESSEK